ncbi:tetratricopeptide repeat protein [Armatimonas sp.]|uniref:tetratricopeptide repeat protein n=1 Tax=Armatimonas sp. TaxID=1872638 RepID=UPI0037521371
MFRLWIRVLVFIIGALSLQMPAQGITWCHDYTFLRVTGKDSNRCDPDRLQSVLREEKYEHCFNVTALPQRPQPRGVEVDTKNLQISFRATEPGSTEPVRLLSGDVLIIGEDHSGIVGKSGWIEHFVQTAGQSGVAYRPERLVLLPNFFVEERGWTLSRLFSKVSRSDGELNGARSVTYAYPYLNKTIQLWRKPQNSSGSWVVYTIDADANTRWLFIGSREEYERPTPQSDVLFAGGSSSPAQKSLVTLSEGSEFPSRDAALRAVVKNLSSLMWVYSPLTRPKEFIQAQVQGRAVYPDLSGNANQYYKGGETLAVLRSIIPALTPRKTFPPQWLVHATGHGTYDGGVKDDLWLMVATGLNAEKKTFTKPDGAGGTFGYTYDQASGPFTESYALMEAMRRVNVRAVETSARDRFISIDELPKGLTPLDNGVGGESRVTPPENRPLIPNIPTPPLITNPSTANAHAAQAGTLIAQGRFDEAQCEAAKAVELQPKKGAFRATLGLCYAWLRNFSLAEKEYREAIRLEPSQGNHHGGLAFVLLQLNRFREAEDSARIAVRSAASVASHHQFLGDALAFQGKWGEAESAYRESVRLDPKLAAGHNGVGGSLLAKSDGAGAEKYFREAVRLNPSEGIFHANLAGALSVQNRQSEALVAAREAKRLGLANHWVYSLLGL